jgi:hypothetical protein
MISSIQEPAEEACYNRLQYLAILTTTGNSTALLPSADIGLVALKRGIRATFPALKGRRAMVERMIA